MTYLSTENLSKRFGEKILFQGLSFGLQKGDKTALVAPNGTGKSSLLKILAGKDQADEGEAMLRNGIRVGFLEQEPELDAGKTISEFINQRSSETVRIIQAYHEALDAQSANYNEKTHQAFERASAEMDRVDGWNYEQRLEQILGKLDIHDLDQSISTLSGGERKRVALAFTLLDEPDLLILDEPTNHLDVDMIEWLEKFLQRSTMSLLMVTHDRYFLDSVCNHILELDGGKLYHHNGNYSFYLQKKAEREEALGVEQGKAIQFLKREIDWIRRSPKARTTKSRSRVDAFYDTQEKYGTKKVEQELKLEVKTSRIGKKILEIKGMNKSFGDKVMLRDFEYTFSKGERIGIIGKNGVGKSTFLKLITGEIQTDSGSLETGETIIYGHFRQQALDFNPEKRVIDVVRDVAEYIEMADGNRISASKFLEHFLFPPSIQYTHISKLSGGEKRRLGLMLVLIKNPNFLILDEPTNDLDLQTMNKLESFLADFPGCLILVSHDRYFMDQLVDHFFVFEGEGIISDFAGTYSEYREMAQEKERAQKQDAYEPKTSPKAASPTPAPKKKKMSYAEQKEFGKLEKEIAQLEGEKNKLEALLASGGMSYEDLAETSEKIGKLIEQIDEKSMRWLELAELAE
ncbi:ABC transporter ATP-binding protein [bacterium]|nr:MAG: ABC transporter ATP-binding protein [bacterium]